MKQEPDVYVPSFYPIHFPFKVQDMILTRTQELLEECCYNFTKEHVPNLLVDKRWECPKAIELNKWTTAIIKRHRQLPAAAFRKSGCTIPQVLIAVNKLHHSAVHQMRISAKGIIQLILRDQDIDTSYLERTKRKSKKKQHRRAYDCEMKKIMGVLCGYMIIIFVMAVNVLESINGNGCNSFSNLRCSQSFRPYSSFIQAFDLGTFVGP